MEAFISFIQTVGAEVVAYYLCKWLDSLFFKGSKQRAVSTNPRSPPVVSVPGGFWFFRGNHGTGLHLIAYL